jgi:hypothetical protein
MTLVLTILVALASATGELVLLDRIFNHPAGGPSDQSRVLIHNLFAVLPYVGVSLWAAMSAERRRRALRCCVAIGLTGLALASIALAQYSHAIGGFLLVGYAGQWIILALGTLAGRRRKAGAGN